MTIAGIPALGTSLDFWAWLRLSAALVLFLAGLLAVVKPPSYFFWKLSIVVMEGGHFLAPPLAILGLWCLAGSAPARVAGILFLAAAGLFGTTYVRAMRMAGVLQKGFEAEWGGRSEGFRRNVPVSLGDMFLGITTPPVAFRTFAYKTVGGSGSGGSAGGSGGPEGSELKLDFYPASLPQAGTPAAPHAAACIIVVHGGGWDGGARSQLSPLNAFLAAQGYAVATLQYRLAPEYRYPAPVEDVADAMAWLRGHANELGIDATRFAILGRSAGGQIALQAAYTSRDPSIKGVIAFYAPADMVFGYSLPTNPLIMDSRLLMEQYLGGGYPEVPADYAASSPVEHLSASSPPTLLLHGRPDVLVSWQHTVRMRAKLESLGVRHFIVDVPWGAHGFDFVFRGPGSQISLYFIERFLAEVLR
jgi:acetyl esterase/lipase